MGEASYSIDENDYVAAQRLHFRRLVTRRPILTVLYIAAIVWGGSVFFKGTTDLPGLAFGLIFLTLVAGLIWWTIPMNARRAYHQRKMWDQLHVTWNDDRIIFTSDRGGGTFNWKDFYRWATDEKSLLLYLDGRLFYVLPLRCFPSGACEEITSALRHAGIGSKN